jgi:hypothetical protein
VAGSPRRPPSWLRDQVDLEEITGGLRDTATDTVASGRVAAWLLIHTADLRDTVVATVAPTRVAVWLRVPTRTEASET